MKKYYEVTAEISARATLVIEAESEAEAIDRADTALTGGEVNIDWREEGRGKIEIDGATDFSAREEKL